jgi:hypothetical protein
MCEGLNEWEDKVVRAAFTTRGVPAGGRLRSNKPFRRESNIFEGCANYVWRMLCFDLVGSGKHACLPVMADCDVHSGFSAELGRIDYKDRGASDARRETVRDMMKLLDMLVGRVEKKLPIASKKGILRWGRALGVI